MKRILCTSAALFALFSPPPSSGADVDLKKAEAFYKGKTITWMIGSTPGGSVDRLSRLVGPTLAKYTGAEVVLQNRPGGGGTSAFNYLYNNAKPDGLRFAFHIGSTLALNTVSDQPGIKYKLDELSFVGVVSPGVYTFMTYAKRFKTIDDLKRADKVRYGMTRPGGNAHFNGIALGKVLGVNLQFVSGYSGSSAVRQALFSGEVDALLYPPSTYMSAMKEGLVAPLVTVGSMRHPAVPDIPTLQEVVKKIPEPFDSWIEIGRVGWFLAGPPKMPGDRLEFLRIALKKAVNDPEVRGNAVKQDFLLDHLGGEEALRITRRFVHMPESEKKELVRLLKGGR